MTQPTPALRAGSNVEIGETKVSLEAQLASRGTECMVSCNGQRVSLLFNGEDVDVTVHDPQTAGS